MSRYSFTSGLYCGSSARGFRSSYQSRTATTSPNNSYLQSELDAMIAYKKESNVHIAKMSENFREKTLAYEERIRDLSRQVSITSRFLEQQPGRSDYAIWELMRPVSRLT